MIPRILKKWTVALFIVLSINTLSGQKTLSAGEVVKRIKANVTCDWQDQTVDTYKAGSEQSQVTGIATTFLANMDVLKAAKEKGINMIITHEPIFYNHYDEIERYGEDPVLQAKLDFLEKNDMVVWRFHDHMHRTEPDGIYRGIVEYLNWQDYPSKDYIFGIPETTLAELASNLKDVFKAKTIRVIGPADARIKHAALRLGSPGSMVHIHALNQEEVDVLIAGEAPEWETIEYVRDAISAGMNKSLILLGHAVSEEAGMAYCAEWLKEFISEVPIEFIPANEPFWAPK